MPYPGIERRKHSRWPCSLEIQLKGGNGSVVAVLRDISKSGARVTVEAGTTPVSPLCLILPDAQGTLHELAVDLVRNQPGDGEDILGLRFSTAKPEDLAPIIEHCRSAG